MTEPKIKKKENTQLAGRCQIVLSDSEVQSILMLVPDPKIRMALTTIYGCDIRFGECVTLRVEDVDLKRGFILIRKMKGYARRILLPQSVSEILAKWLHMTHPGMWLFPKGEGHISVSVLQKAFKWALVQSGIKKQASLHTLRRSFYVNQLIMLEASATHELASHTCSGITNNITKFYIERASVSMPPD